MSTPQSFSRLVEIIKKLRHPDGCPWDRKQTIETFKPYLLEEMHELLEAIDHNDIANIKEELGDLFFQLIFINNLYEEQAHFRLDDVLTTISEKMIRRHPHVFEGKEFASESEMRANWNRIKTEEKAAKKSAAKHSIFSFPKTLPALLRAQRVSERAAKSGFEWLDTNQAFDKLEEEIDELKTALASSDPEDIKEEVGDLLLTMVNISRLAGIQAEEALQGATEKFTGRFTELAEQVNKAGEEIHKLPLEKLLEYWQKAKFHQAENKAS